MRERLVTLILLLAGGMLITIALAWASAAWGLVHRDPGRLLVHEDNNGWLVHERKTLTGRHIAMYPKRTDIVIPSQLLFIPPPRTEVQVKGMPRGVSRLAELEPARPVTSEPRRFAVDERGWPMRCLRSETALFVTPPPSNWDGIDHIDSVEVVGGILLWREKTLEGLGWPGQRVRVLPTTPVWPGLVVNSLFFAIVLAVTAIMIRWTVAPLTASALCARIIVASVIGATLTVCIAWASAGRQPPTTISPSSGFASRDVDPADPFMKFRSWLAVHRWDSTTSTRFEYRGTSFPRLVGADSISKHDAANVLPWWSGGADAQHFRPFNEGVLLYVRDAHGWPFAAMSSSFRHSASRRQNQPIVESGILLQPVSQNPTEWSVTVRILPTHVLWPGFLANAFILGLLAFILLCLLRAIRVQLRTARGLCVRCAYDLRGSGVGGCPECGWGRIAEGSASRERRSPN